MVQPVLTHMMSFKALNLDFPKCVVRRHIEIPSKPQKCDLALQWYVRLASPGSRGLARDVNEQARDVDVDELSVRILPSQCHSMCTLEGLPEMSMNKPETSMSMNCQ